jgi:thiamine pyrophosphate-dependent acetolactate synthase large subunit-like protein
MNFRVGAPKDIARLVAKARQGLSVEPVALLVPRDVQFTSIAAHGQMAAPVTLVRAEIIVDGGPPPDDRAVRYFRVSRQFGGGWMVVGETDSYRYFMELLP